MNSDTKNKVALSVVDLQEDPVYRSVEIFNRRPDGTSERVNPEVKVNLLVLFTANLGDYMTVDGKTGVILIEGKDLSDLDYDQLAALGEVTTDTHTQGEGFDRVTVTKVKVKLHNKLTALDMLMRHSGQSREKQPLDGAASLIDRILAGRERTRAREKEENDN